MRLMTTFAFTTLLVSAACADMEGPDTMDIDGEERGDTALASHQFQLGGQTAWFHDEGYSYGVFHTYDAFKVAGPSDAPRKVHVFVPRDYAQSGRRYPVIYMNDGNTTFWPGGAAGKAWQVAETLSDLREAGSIEDVIVVAIHPIDREREYTHAFWAPGRACCGLDSYTNYVAQHVKGFMDANYRTKPEADSTMIIGSSHGGLAAFYMATRRPDVFGNAAALSSSFWAGLDFFGVSRGGPLASSALVSPVASLLRDSARRPRLWIDWGMRRDGGFHNSVIENMATDRGREMVQILTGAGYTLGSDLFRHEDAIGGHDEDAWAYRFGLIMEAFFPAP